MWWSSDSAIEPLGLPLLLLPSGQSPPESLLPFCAVGSIVALLSEVTGKVTEILPLAGMVLVADRGLLCSCPCYLYTFESEAP